MGSDAKLTKKQKKALAFRERKGKGKDKAKGTDTETDNAVPVMEDQDIVEMEVEAVDVVPEEGSSQGKAGHGKVAESKKRKRQTDDAEGNDEEKSKQKKKRKGANDSKPVVSKDEEGGEEAGKESEQKMKHQRLILFVGNLKYSTTKEAIQKHFSACDPPPTVRLMTPKPTANGKQTTKSKGFAFLEFQHKSGLQQALKLHHSELQGRMINVELTAGGGGKSERRLAKVKERNKELFEQRKKRVEKQKGEDAESGLKDLVRSQRYSATSGVDQAPTNKRTWSIADGTEEPPKKKRGSKKPARSLGTGVNAIPVG